MVRPATASVARALLGTVPEARRATLARFRGADGTVVDQGLALWFPAPASFTGEDVLELHGHGGAMVLDLVVEAALAEAAEGERFQFEREGYFCRDSGASEAGKPVFNRIVSLKDSWAKIESQK